MSKFRPWKTHFIEIEFVRKICANEDMIIFVFVGQAKDSFTGVLGQAQFSKTKGAPFILDANAWTGIKKRLKDCKVEVEVSVYFNSQLAFLTIIKDVLFQEGIYTVHARINM